MVTSAIEMYFQFITRVLMKIFRVEIPIDKNKRTRKDYVLMIVFWLASTFLGFFIVCLFLIIVLYLIH